MKTGRVGQFAEMCARAYLEKRGLVWVGSNYRCLQGEIDLIMRDRDMLVFVEVRYRRQPQYGGGAETVSRRKQQRLISAATHYLLTTRQMDKEPCRFDVIGLSQEQEIDWIQNAFEVSY